MYGANQSLCTLILELRDKYHINPVVLLKNEGSICDFLNEYSIRYYIINFYWWVNSDKGIFQKVLNIRKQFRNSLKVDKFIEIIKKENIDLLYTNSTTINIGALLHKKLNIPHIWHFRESLDQFHFKFSLGKYYSKRLLKNGADQYVLISKFLLKDYSSFLPKDKTAIIYNGVQLSQQTMAKLKEDRWFNLCVVGIVCEQKNQLDALKAIRILVKEKGYTNIRMHLIGGANEAYLKIISDYIDSERLKDYVLFHGHIKDVHNLMSKMDIGLICARDEAFGRVSVEYMLHRLPVVASNSGANSELVIPGISGDLYELNNSIDLAAKIENYINNPDLIKKTGNSACDFAKANFSSESNTREIYEVIKEVMSKTKFNKLRSHF
mgnify:CR=1 FL=1